MATKPRKLGYDPDHALEQISNKRSAKLPNGLTIKQHTFACMVAEGHNYTQSYRIAYGIHGDQNTPWIQVEACKLRKHPIVSQTIEDQMVLLNEQQSTLAVTRDARVLGTLESIMRDGKTETARLRAAELLGKTTALFKITDNSDSEAQATLADIEGKLLALLDKGIK